MSILFTQYMLPHGRAVPTAIDRPVEIEELAEKVIAAGGRFETEVLTTGEVSVSVAREDEDIAIEIVENGPEVLDAVDRLVRKAAEMLRPVKLDRNGMLEGITMLVCFEVSTPGAPLGPTKVYSRTIRVPYKRAFYVRLFGELVEQAATHGAVAMWTEQA